MQNAIIGDMKVIVSDVIIIQDNKILLVQERKQKAYGLWNFPGGKVEADETPEKAAYRDVKEELNVELVGASLLKSYPYRISGVDFDLKTFIGNIKGDITIKADEIMAYGWFSLEQIYLMKDQLRGIIILEQARDALRS